MSSFWVIFDPVVEVLELVMGAIGVEVNAVDALPIRVVQLEDLSVNAHVAAVVSSPMKAAMFWRFC